MASKDDVEAMQAAIFERFLGVLTAVGDEDAVRAGIECYRESGATSPWVGAIQGTDSSDRPVEMKAPTAIRRLA
ncbi:MAG TPA: hypothetical protein VHI73_05195 [Solirubrobacteraceae bacterium]|nr:hypothetical protein [Solirubrobacteraceae bacterium]